MMMIIRSQRFRKLFLVRKAFTSVLTDGARTAVELPTDLSLDDWTQYVCLKDFGYMLPIASPQRAMEVFRLPVPRYCAISVM